MQDHRETNQILHYFKFAFNAFFDSFNQITLVVVSITLPIAVVAYSIQPEIVSIVKDKSDVSSFLILKWLFSQAILRAVSIFVFILVILHHEDKYIRDCSCKTILKESILFLLLLYDRKNYLYLGSTKVFYLSVL